MRWLIKFVHYTDVAKELDAKLQDVTKALEPQWKHLSHKKLGKDAENIEDFMAAERQRLAGGR